MPQKVVAAGYHFVKPVRVVRKIWFLQSSVPPAGYEASRFAEPGSRMLPDPHAGSVRYERARRRLARYINSDKPVNIAGVNRSSMLQADPPRSDNPLASV